MYILKTFSSLLENTIYIIYMKIEVPLKMKKVQNKREINIIIEHSNPSNLNPWMKIQGFVILFPQTRPIHMYIKKKKHFSQSFPAPVKVLILLPTVRDLFLKARFYTKTKINIKKWENERGRKHRQEEFPVFIHYFLVLVLDFFYYLFCLSFAGLREAKFERKRNPPTDLRERATTYRTEY